MEKCAEFVVRDIAPSRQSYDGLAREQRALPLHAPSIARERAIGSYHAVTRNGDRDVVGRACLRDGTSRFGSTDAPGDFCIAHSCTGRDLAQCLPHTMLKRRSTYVEWKIEPLVGRLQKSHDRGHELLELCVAANQLRFREAILKRAHQRVRIIAKQNGADTRVARGDDERSQ